MGRILNILEYLKDCFLEIIFPAPYKCIVCNETEEEGLCKECRRTITECTESEHFGYYKGALKELIFLFKFNKDFLAGEILVDLIKDKLNGIEKDYIITYIPISKKSMRKRGFNQCEYIAKKLSKIHGLKCINTLKKIKETKCQKQLTKKERLENIKNSFGVIDKKLIENNRFILIDDVLTTGATIKEGIRVLKENGAKEIKLLTIAKSRL
ncbi:ComF family protein [Clostridium baratii]|uniref:Phosphoribosyl transferase domain protein n=1 Tax=Clostridium baratii str. Sullivan TaxID=1415775 RepID=A0A0A7G0F2_9CLOT|nr:ComF family protein [Clostridium baratii]AIY84591.1 phosphoribosyl transferase domain protein [Clostridium baratii str. Sullivan]MDU1052477.1 ComF family protein [Clostridium baratii]MDU4909967.1 ComF family protein [Clostridium baratii]CUP36346.1 putative amidophosphoribosyltransferase [Clostridium baratii]